MELGYSADTLRLGGLKLYALKTERGERVWVLDRAQIHSMPTSAFLAIPISGGSTSRFLAV